MKTQKQINGKFAKRGMILVAMLSLLGVVLPAARGAVQILYNFDGAGNTTTTAIDSQSGDGSQNASAVVNSWALTPTSGPDGSTAAAFNTSAQLLGTDSVINYPHAMTWSLALNLTAPGPSYTTLMWAGWHRGVGETVWYVDGTGHMIWDQAGGALPRNITSTAGSLLTPGTWEYLGVTFDDTVGGGTLNFYKNGVNIQTLTGLGTMQGNGNAASPTVLGYYYNVGGLEGKFNGLMDNVFMADRALSPTEMAALEALPTPEPSTMMLLGLGGLLMLRRHRKR